MQDILSYLAEPETIVVFDIDGVLAPYEFGELSHTACLDGDWKAYVLEEHPYAHIRPVPQIQRFIEKKGTERVFACSVAEDYEEEGKRSFVTTNYGLPADHVKLVRSKAGKVDELRALAKEFAVPERRVALVEDTVKTLDEVARKTGCTTVHVSSFFFA